MTADDLRAGLKRSPVSFEVGGLTLWLKPWTVATRAAFSEWRQANPGVPGLMEKLFALSVCDESGALLFADAADVGEFDGLVVEKVGERVLQLNGMSGDAGKN